MLSGSAPGPLDYLGTIGQLVGAAATVTAVTVALWVARRDGRRAAAERADRDAAQARLILAAPIRLDGRWWVRTTNYSSAPVFAVRVPEVRQNGSGRAVADTDGAPAVLDVLAAGQSLDRLLDGGDEPEPHTVVLEFLDAAGLRWRRAGTGQPRRVLG